MLISGPPRKDAPYRWGCPCGATWNSDVDKMPTGALCGATCTAKLFEISAEVVERVEDEFDEAAAVEPWEVYKTQFIREAAEIFERELAARGMNQKDLALAAGLSQPHVNRMLRGQRGMTLQMLARLSAAVGIRLRLVVDDMPED